MRLGKSNACPHTTSVFVGGLKSYGTTPSPFFRSFYANRLAFLWPYQTSILRSVFLPRSFAPSLNLVMFTPSFTSLLLTLLGALSLARYVSNRRRQDIYRLPSAPREIAHWLWGHELLSFEHEATEMYSKWVAICGPFFKIKAALFHSDLIVAADHAAVQHIFQNADDYVKSPAFRPPVANVLGKGLVWAEGDDHKKQRRILAPAFSPEAIKGMADDVSECSEKLESRLTNYVLAHGGSATVNIVEYTSTCTLDIIGRVAFGHDFKSGQSTEAKEIHASWTGHVNTGLTFGAFIAMLVIRALPFITQIPLPAIKAGGRIREIVSKLAMRIVQSGTVAEKGKDILSVLIKADRKHGSKTDGLTSQQLVDNVSTFIMVGHETTAGSLSFTLLELARKPEVQQRLREEVRQFGRDLGYDDIQKLEFLDAVVKEGLRMHPASPQTERVALKDDVIPLSKPIQTANGETLSSIRVKAGQVFHVPFTTMNTNPDVWGPDAREFKPERWVTPGGVPPPSDLPHGWSGIVTFCDGPRNCIGYRLAIFEFKIILATLVRSLEFHDTTAEIHEKISPTLQPVTDGKGGLLPIHVTLAA
ncbi:11-oxo-beta-amyrin 30-oxidase [Grifola frondosa]|uniref:11-oxo-beta-amyrin 30-oxidase n=1 Tax=Grifola frondosa TaxID=5627 RepID=A0A1C7LRN2_GRIFR|nr:11-oxo-beta-amyrin 30-oxidase [Grifola frondosa]